jgi:trans-aconitate 2-methyltransferase
LAPFGGRVVFVKADLGRPLPVQPPVDAILSTATFHWVLDHDALFGNLAAPEETQRRLRAAGFAECRAWLQEERTTFDTRPEFEAFLATVVLRTVLASRPREGHAAFVSEVADKLGKPELDYVRLNIDAVRD